MNQQLASHSIIATPWGRLGLRAEGERLSQVDFLPSDTPLIASQSLILQEAERQMQAYFCDSQFVFDLPYHLNGTPHQLKVWHAIRNIAAGEVLSYAAIARQISSAPRAIGGACGRNPIPIVIPCHRVVAAKGLGGFNANRNGFDWLPIKRYLLRHEGVVYGD